MNATKERLHHLIDEIQDAEANEILQYAETLKEHKNTNPTKEMNKVEMDPDCDDEVWMYVC